MENWECFHNVVISLSTQLPLYMEHRSRKKFLTTPWPMKRQERLSHPSLKMAQLTERENLHSKQKLGGGTQQYYCQVITSIYKHTLTFPDTEGKKKKIIIILRHLILSKHQIKEVLTFQYCSTLCQPVLQLKICDWIGEDSSVLECKFFVEKNSQNMATCHEPMMFAITSKHFLSLIYIVIIFLNSYQNTMIESYQNYD